MPQRETGHGKYTRQYKTIFQLNKHIKILNQAHLLIVHVLLQQQNAIFQEAIVQLLHKNLVENRPFLMKYILIMGSPPSTFLNLPPIRISPFLSLIRTSSDLLCTYKLYKKFHLLMNNEVGCILQLLGNASVHSMNDTAAISFLDFFGHAHRNDTTRLYIGLAFNSW